MIDERILGDTAKARGLPGKAFTSQAFLDSELKTVFARSWTCIGFAHEVSEGGDLCPVTFAGLPLFLLRDRDDTIRVFHNVCPHRGMRLVRAPAKGRHRLTCPYHCWTYDLQGRLIFRPYFAGPEDHDGNVEPGDDTPGLTDVRAARWFDAVFVNLDGAAPPFEVYAQDFLTTVADYGDRTASRPVGALDYDLKSNWKLVLENALDSYHIKWVHPNLQTSTPMSAYAHDPIGNVCRGQAILASDRPGFGQADLPRWPRARDEVADRMTYCLLFPNFLAAMTVTRMAIFQVSPLAPDRTAERLLFYMPEESNPAYAEERRAFVDSYREINDEDVWAVEELQRSRHSPAFDGGRFSPHWDRITHHFARLVAEAWSTR